MKQLILTAVIFLIGLNVFSQKETSNIKNDTIGYNQELKEFYQFLSKNYNQYKAIDLNNIKIVSPLEKECGDILGVIDAKTKYIENVMTVPVYIGDRICSYISYDLGGKNYPKVYKNITKLQKYTQKMLKTKNKDRLIKLNIKLVSIIDQILNNNTTTNSYIYKTYEEFNDGEPSVTLYHEKGDVIKYSFPARLKTRANETEAIYKPGDIWGFKMKGELYRYYQPNKQKEVDWEFKLYYKVIYNEDIVVYSVDYIGGLPTDDDYTLFYYSDNLVSEIKKVNDKNLTNDFADKPEIIEAVKKLTNK